MPWYMQGARRREDTRRGVRVLRVHEVQQCPHGAFRATLIGPHDELGCEHIHPAQLRDPRRGDPVPAPGW